MNSMQNLRAACGDMKQKSIKFSKNSVLQPSKITLEVLTNGATCFKPCVIIRTETNVYLINVPEGFSRLNHLTRIKPGAVNDILITRKTPNCIGGLSGFLIGKDSAADNDGAKTRFHGVSHVLKYIKDIQPLADEDFGRKKFHATFDIVNPEEGEFRDDGFVIKSIPIMADHNSGGLSYCFLFEGLPPPSRLDPNKIMALNQPKGKWIAELKAGRSVTLADGRLIEPESVYLYQTKGVEKTNVLILDIASVEEIKSLTRSSLLFPYFDGKRKLDYVVHLVGQEVYECAEYQAFKSRVNNAETVDILVNGSNKEYPNIDSAYQINQFHNSICPQLFPLLHDGKTIQEYSNDDDRLSDLKQVVCKPFQRFNMRGVENFADGIRIGMTKSRDPFEVPQNLIPEFEKLKKDVDEEMGKLSNCDSNSVYPELTVLGTASAVPSKYRNVSSYFVRLSETSSIMVDCGESTWAQLHLLYGQEKLDSILVNLNAVFMTHAHQDHINGLFGLILERKKAFDVLGIAYKAMSIVGNRNIERFIDNYHNSMFKIKDLINFVQIYFVPAGSSPNARPPLVVETTSLMDPTLYNPQDWNLKSAKSVAVKHMGAANGYVFQDMSGKRFVFSGDTMPCETLVNAGMGADFLVHEATFEDSFEKEAPNEKAFDVLGIAYKAMSIVGNRNIERFIDNYHNSMFKIKDLINFVQIYFVPAGSSPNARPPLVVETTSLMDPTLYNPQDWNLKSAKSVAVKHMGAANGYVFQDMSGKRFVFSGDTMPCETLVNAGMGADFLVHEATFEDSFEKEAYKKKHSTMKQAVTAGEQMKAKNVLLTHFSARYPKIPCLPAYLDSLEDATTHSPNTGIAADFMQIKWYQWPIVPKLTAMFRLAFAEELFLLQERLHQRVLVGKPIMYDSTKRAESPKQPVNSLKRKRDQ
uniref:Ribonuclease Z n=2 Tax=Rhabditophanes sp. KR3021 TaxID=114890 RepID=A0AC35UE88_9BILA